MESVPARIALPSRARTQRRRSVAAAAVAVGFLGVVPGVGIASAAGHSPAGHRGGSCPAAESLVPQTTWHHHRLANGVTMASGTTTDDKGVVNMHVLRADLSRPRIGMQPLEHRLAERLPLSELAHGHPHLVAATNTGYFDFDTGAPTDPLIVKGAPQVLSSQHQTVVGIGRNGRLEAGDVWLSSKVTVGKDSQDVAARNETYPPDGIGVYDARWGSTHVPGGWNTVNRQVSHGAISSGTLASHNATVPNHGFVLQARGRSASDWLHGLSAGAKVSVSTSVKTDATSPFAQAYGVGAQLVAQPGQVKTGFSCDSSNTKQPARTAIGWTNGGRTLVMAVVADHPHTSMHGLDEDQMSKLMVQLGVSQAYALDGSGSTELLAQVKGSSSLKMQNYPADGAERPMPVGLGITVAPASHRHHKHH